MSGPAVKLNPRNFSERAGQRVMKSITRFITQKLKLSSSIVVLMLTPLALRVISLLTGLDLPRAQQSHDVGDFRSVEL